MNILYSLYYEYGRIAANKGTGMIRDAKFAKSKSLVASFL